MRIALAEGVEVAEEKTPSAFSASSARDLFISRGINNYNNNQMLSSVLLLKSYSMVKNSRLLFCSRDMHKFMEANDITSIQQMFEIPIDQLVLMSNFPYRLLTEWVSLRDRFNLLVEN